MYAALIRRAAAVALPVLAGAALFVTPAHAQAAELHIVKHNLPAGTAERWVLTCHPDDGTHPDPFAACDRLRRIGGDLERIRFRPDVPCPRIFDPVRVEINGWFYGQHKHFDEHYPNPCFVEKIASPIVP
ncbi:hypothetical protein GCM10022224_049080 [Nonomuraea antimicrobica]|uniref:Subtilisin inhibitor domain-containing protein n=1 Tax=Nonomuraea antimicrobica TaxID=561173 RepID=A0ABP7C3W9_9ACTN